MRLSWATSAMHYLGGGSAGEASSRAMQMARDLRVFGGDLRAEAAAIVHRRVNSLATRLAADGRPLAPTTPDPSRKPALQPARFKLTHYPMGEVLDKVEQQAQAVSRT